MKKNKIFLPIILIGIVLLVCCSCNKKNNENPPTPNNPNGVIKTDPKDITYTYNTSFDYKMIRKNHETHNNSNYMISPLSIAYALSVLKEGASGNTKTEIENALGNYSLPKIVNLKDRISLANALFIKKNFSIKDSYVKNIKDNYNSDLIYDEFKTPKKINDWVNNKTFGMIDKAVDEISPNFRLGIANALAIDVEWLAKFECNDTKKEEFNTPNGKMNTAMMHITDTVKYFETEKAKGIIKNYQVYDSKTGEAKYLGDDGDIELEYIAILPDDIDEYIRNLDEKELKNIKNNIKNDGYSNVEIRLGLPKYTYEYTYTDFQKGLMDLGIKDAFNAASANFNNISNEDLYVESSIHKSFIELSENGTKAAAITIFMMDSNAAPVQKKNLYITFDKPFIYIIKDKNSDNIWFFGTVYEPIKWEDNKCETKAE